MKTKIPQTKEILVSYSGGKDSLAVMDICGRASMRLEAFFMYLVPGLDYTAFWCEYAQKRWGVSVRTYPHWALSRDMSWGLFMHQPLKTKGLGYFEMIDHVREEMHQAWCAIGLKSVDSLERRALMNKWPAGISIDKRIWCPLKHWTQTEVVSYLKSREIILPDKMMQAKNTGVSLHPQCLLYFRENWPDDYDRILKYFPLASAQADRAVELHAKEESDRQSRQSKRKYKYDRSRKSSATRGYDHAWREVIVPAILRRDPVCKCCGIAASTDVDHILAKRDGGPDDYSNLQGLCHSCHSSKTVEDIGLNTRGPQ